MKHSVWVLSSHLFLKSPLQLFQCRQLLSHLCVSGMEEANLRGKRGGERGRGSGIGSGIGREGEGERKGGKRGGKEEGEEEGEEEGKVYRLLGCHG